MSARRIDTHVIREAPPALADQQQTVDRNSCPGHTLTSVDASRQIPADQYQQRHGHHSSWHVGQRVTSSTAARLPACTITSTLSSIQERRCVSRPATLWLIALEQQPAAAQAAHDRSGQNHWAMRSTATICGSDRAAARSAIKQFIMNANVVVGVGNIYASEALFLAGINPRRAAGRIAQSTATTCWPTPYRRCCRKRSRPAARPCGTSTVATARPATSNSSLRFMVAKTDPVQAAHADHRRSCRVSAQPITARHCQTLELSGLQRSTQRVLHLRRHEF